LDLLTDPTFQVRIIAALKRVGMLPTAWGVAIAEVEVFLGQRTPGEARERWWPPMVVQDAAHQLDGPVPDA